MTEARIQLSNGVLFDLLEPDPELIEIEAIAHSLSMLCRFTGHSAEFYSVAQHCVVVSRLVPAELALRGLLHDASEAFVGDVATPLKRLLPDYKVIETGIERAIGERFGASVDLAPATIKHADRVALATERRDLGLPGNDEYWNGLPEPAAFEIKPLAPASARYVFLARFAEIILRPGLGQAPSREELMNRVPRGPGEDYWHEKPDPNRFDTNEDISRRLAAAEVEEDDGTEWTVVG